MIDWTGGYSATWEIKTVNERTWDDDGALPLVTSVDVRRDGTDDVPLLETGTMEMDGRPGFEGRWCRIYMVAEQGGAERHAMATLLFEKASAHFEKGAYTTSMTGRSVLQPAADRKLYRGAFAAEGSDGAAYVGRLLSACTPAPVHVEGSFTLSDDVVFDIGASHLDAAWAVLKAGDWCIQVDGRGEVYVRAKPSEVALELSIANTGLLIPGVDDDYSLVDIPNRYYAVNDSEMAVATNEDPTSPVSKASRGRWVDEVDESPTLVDGEPLEAYAKRKLREASLVTRTYTYKREWWPGVTVFSRVRATIPSNGIEGDLRVLKQELECGKGVVVNETSGMEVQL